MNRFWSSVLKRLCEILEPRDIVEIGAEKGLHTSKLLEYCEEHHCQLHVIDPNPEFDVGQLEERFGTTFKMHRGLSLNMLEQVPSMDLVLIDGDHNWYTVYNELKLIERLCGDRGLPLPFFVLHDTAWPYGRRDMYYNPDTIPDAYRHPFKKSGIVPGRSELVVNKGINRAFCNSIYENTNKSGVRTAIEDFLREHSDVFDVHFLPILSGLALVCPNELRLSLPALDRYLKRFFVRSPLQGLLTELEEARIELLVQSEEKRYDVLWLQDKRNKDLEEAAAATRQLADAESQARESLLRAEQTIRDLRQQCDNRNLEIALAKQGAADLVERISRQSERLQTLTSDKYEITLDLQKLQFKVERAKNRITLLGAKYCDLKSRYKQLHESHRAELRVAYDRLSEAESATSRLSGSLECVSASNARLEQRLLELNSIEDCFNRRVREGAEQLFSTVGYDPALGANPRVDALLAAWQKAYAELLQSSGATTRALEDELSRLADMQQSWLDDGARRLSETVGIPDLLGPGADLGSLCSAWESQYLALARRFTEEKVALEDKLRAASLHSSNHLSQGGKSKPAPLISNHGQIESTNRGVPDECMPGSAALLDFIAACRQRAMHRVLASLNDHVNFLLIERERQDIHLRRLIRYIEALFDRGSAILESRRWWVGDRLCRVIESATLQNCGSVSPSRFVAEFNRYRAWKSNYVAAQKGRIAWSVLTSCNDADTLSSLEKSVAYKSAVIDRLLAEIADRKGAITSLQTSFRNLDSWGHHIVRSYRYRIGRALFRASLGFLQGLRGDRLAEALDVVSLDFQEWSRVYLLQPDQGEIVPGVLNCKREADLTLAWLRSHDTHDGGLAARYTEDLGARRPPISSVESSPPPSATGIRVTQFTLPNPRNPYYVVVGSLLRSRGWDFNYCVDQKRLLADVRSNDSSLDIVHFHQLEPKYHSSSGCVSETRKLANSLLSYLRELKTAGARLVWTMHNPLPHDRMFSEIDSEFTKRASLLMDRIVVLGAHAQQCMLNHVSPEKVSIVLHSSLSGYYGPMVDKEKARAALGLDSPDIKFIFGSFGEIKPYKGLEDIVDAFQRACANCSQMLDSKLVLVGKPGPSDYVRSLADRASGSILLLPEEVQDSDVSTWLGAFDASVFCFRDIWMSSSVALSLSYLTPVIVPDLGCLPEYLSDEGAGLFYRHGSVESMSKAMQKMRTTPLQAHMRYMCGKFNRDHSVEKIASEFASVYASVARLHPLGWREH